MPVRINKRGDVTQLRLLFPRMAVSKTGVPVYAPVVYSPVEFPVAGRALFLLQDPAGFAVDTQLGFCNFLKEIQYMAASKVDRLARMDFSSCGDAPCSMYKEAAALKVANKTVSVREEEDPYFTDVLASPLALRLAYAEAAGWEQTLSRLVALLSKYLRGELKGVQRAKLEPLMLRFDRRSCKSYSMSGDAEADCSALLSMFGL